MKFNEFPTQPTKIKMLKTHKTLLFLYIIYQMMGNIQKRMFCKLQMEFFIKFQSQIQEISKISIFQQSFKIFKLNQ